MKLYYISCLNGWGTNSAALRNQKFCCGTVFQHKIDETKNFSDLQLKAEYQKGACFLSGQTEVISVVQGEESSPHSPLGYVPAYYGNDTAKLLYSSYEMTRNEYKAELL